MCDTMVVTGEDTADGCVVFAKNSDREPGEAQALEHHPAADRRDEGSVQCTYIAVPQVAATHGVLLSRPHWMWGAEMGANDQGLAVGNEAVFTRAPMQEVGLLGMDLVRLTLERAGTAEQGVTVLTGLLEEHGQGGAAGHRDASFRYHNSFLLADREDAWIVETADRLWVAERVRGIRSISNGLTIGTRWDRASDAIEARARDLGLFRGKGDLDFARTFGDPGMTLAAAARWRRRATEGCLGAGRGAVTPLLAMRALRQHSLGDGRQSSAGVLSGVCAHASWWPTRRSGQTTASMVSRLGAVPVHFVTATAAPCTTVFKPVWFDARPADLGPTPNDRFDPASIWWRHEPLHRRALADLPRFLASVGREREALERRIVRLATSASDSGAGPGERSDVTRSAFDAAEELESDWSVRCFTSRTRLPGPLYRRFWWSIDEASGLRATR